MKKTRKKMLSLILSLSMIFSMFSMLSSPVSAETYDSKTDFMSGKYGIFLHYLNGNLLGSNSSIDSWNNAVNSCDVDRIAESAAQTGASWVTITLTQGDGICCIPMPEMEAITGIPCGSSRDLVADLSAALDKKGIKLMLYWYPGAPDNDAMATALGATDRVSAGGDWILNDTLVNNMTSVMTAISQRYGNKIAGWWLDGCYDSIGFNDTYANLYATALRAGNNNSVISFNAGTAYGDCRFPVENYSAGETCHPNTVSTNNFLNYSTNTRWTDNGFQKHYLTFLGSNWGAAGTIYETNALVQHSYNKILKNGGAISFDVKSTAGGILDTDQCNQLIALKNYAESSKASMPLKFENGTRESFYTANVYGAEVEKSTSAEYIKAVNGSEALNGNYSLRVNVPAGVTRTDVVLDKTIIGNPDFSKTDFSKASGIMLRVKISDNAAASSHSFALKIDQTGIEKSTWLGRKAVCYDLDGNIVDTLYGDLKVNLPASFDGFVFMPFESACSEHITTPGQYDTYATFPEQMVDFSKDYRMMVMLNSQSWGGASVSIDDIGFYSGTTNAEAWNYLRSLGYDILLCEQPDFYNMPLNFEGFELPFTNATPIYIDKKPSGTGYPSFPGNYGVITKTDAINGKISYKMTLPQRSFKNETEEMYLGNVKTGSIKFSGIPALSREILTSADTEYAYFKLRLKVSQNSDNTPYHFSINIAQSGCPKAVHLTSGVIGYDVNGTRNNNVFNSDSLNISVPSGFDGYIYVPYTKMISEQVINGAYSTYQNNPSVMPDFGSQFEMYFFLSSSNWDGQSFMIDDLDTIYNYNDLTFNFNDYLTKPFTYISNVYGGAEHNDGGAGIAYVSGNESLNGSNSLKISIPSIADRASTNSCTIPGNAKFTYDNLDNVTGIMLRMKINEADAASTAQHLFMLRATQSGKPTTILGNSNVILYDTEGNIVPCTYKNFGFMMPAAFDGYIFIPFESQRATDGTWTRYDGTNGSYFIDYSAAYNLSIDFGIGYSGEESKTWKGCDVVVDDISYYSGSYSGQNYDHIRSLGYEMVKADQPDSYSLPMDFENYNLPFSNMKSYYKKDTTYPEVNGVNKLIGSKGSISGNTSLQVSVPYNSSYTTDSGYNFIRAESSSSTFKGVSSLSKTILQNATVNYAYLKFRIQLPQTADGSSYSFYYCINQDGSDLTYLSAGAKGFNIDGTANTGVSSSDVYIVIPSGFDGYIQVPFRNMLSRTIINGSYSHYYNNPDVMPDLSRDFNMYLNCYGENWAGTDFIIDDMSVIVNTPGDISGDGKVNAEDLVLMKKGLLGISSISVEKMDVNGDGNVDIKDLVRIKKLISNIV